MNEEKQDLSKDVIKKFNEIYSLVKKQENYVPRDYQTMGGMWTVDTYKLDNFIVQMMDEGYTQVIKKMLDDKVEWSAVSTIKGISFNNISISEFLKISLNVEIKENKKMKP